ncbi:MAG TPA: hypothetical protein VM925_05550, partial [Labilithrix sp.]|nr:hypothetical protein [Labilithrix sp.]
VPPVLPRDQRLMTAIDAIFTDFASAPMLVDLEAAVGCSGRTLARHIGDLHARYGLLGRGAGRFRGIRDSARLVLSTIFLSHESATPAAVAASVGYGSVEALDHAFRDAGLPAPRALQRAVSAAA